MPEDEKKPQKPGLKMKDDAAHGALLEKVKAKEADKVEQKRGKYTPRQDRFEAGVEGHTEKELADLAHTLGTTRAALYWTATHGGKISVTMVQKIRDKCTS